MHRRHPFRPLVGFVFAGLVATLAFTSAGVAKEPAAISGGDFIQATYRTPQGLSNEPVNVMVQLAGKTVAEVMAEQGRITASTKADIKAALSAPQDAIKPAIQSVGGQVLADYQVAYNGIKVRIAPNLMDRLRALPGVIGVHFIPNHERVERDQRSLSRRADRVERPELHPRSEPQDRGHRHRDRLHARQLPCPGNRRDSGRVRSGERRRHASGEPGVLRPRPPRRSRADSTSSVTTTTRSGTGAAADSSARSQPARLQRSRLARRAVPRPDSACSRTAQPSAVRTTRRRYTPRTGSASARASLLERISTPSACSVARARRTRPSTRSSGRSTTAWTSSTCRSAPRSERATTRLRSRRTTLRSPASSS